MDKTPTVGPVLTYHYKGELIWPCVALTYTQVIASDLQNLGWPNTSSEGWTGWLKNIGWSSISWRDPQVKTTQTTLYFGRPKVDRVQKGSKPFRAGCYDLNNINLSSCSGCHMLRKLQHAGHAGTCWNSHNKFFSDQWQTCDILLNTQQRRTNHHAS
jgi:hypothetical protein